MTDRTLIPAPGLQPGDAVLTPTRRLATVVAVDPAKGEAVIEWPSERAAFRVGHLHRCGPCGPVPVFLDLNPRAAPESGDTPTEATQEGEA